MMPAKRSAFAGPLASPVSFASPWPSERRARGARMDCPEPRGGLQRTLRRGQRPRGRRSRAMPPGPSRPALATSDQPAAQRDLTGTTTPAAPLSERARRRGAPDQAMREPNAGTERSNPPHCAGWLRPSGAALDRGAWPLSTKHSLAPSRRRRRARPAPRAWPSASASLVTIKRAPFLDPGSLS